MNQVLAADNTVIDMTCDSEKPAIMLAADRPLDAERMRNFGIALGSSDLYPNAEGYYLNVSRPVRIFEYEPDAKGAALMMRFRSECSAVNLCCDDFYQTELKPMRLSLSAGDYAVTLCNEADLPLCMAG